jgi:UDP-N-acetylglucosamine kinase
VSGIDPQRYVLDEARSLRIFREEIVPEELAGPSPVTHPVVVFVAGQPGAGKTMTTAAAVGQFADAGGAAAVNSDFYKPYHPRYAELLVSDDVSAAPYMSVDGRRWMGMAQAYAIEHRVNVAIETTMRDQGDFLDPVGVFGDAGFRVEAAVMAVPAALSRLGIVARYAEQVAASGSGRLTEVANHDASYAGVLGAASAMDNGSCRVDQVSVWRRGNRLLFAQERPGQGGGGRQRSPGVVSAITAERNRLWDHRQAARFLTEVGVVARSGHQVVREQIPAIRALARPLLPPGVQTATLSASSFGAIVGNDHHTPGKNSGPPRSRRPPRGQGEAPSR